MRRLLTANVGDDDGWVLGKSLGWSEGASLEVSFELVGENGATGLGCAGLMVGTTTCADVRPTEGPPNGVVTVITNTKRFIACSSWVIMIILFLFF